MPELPEVETTRRALAPVLEGATVERLVVRDRRLRWPVPAGLEQVLAGKRVVAVRRRAKYLLVCFHHGTLVIHLGMSGSIRILRAPLPPPATHDHVDLQLKGGACLRYSDPRRFGAWVWVEGPVGEHPLLCKLGPEPEDASAEVLHERARKRRSTVKAFIMDNANLVGVGNIYAAESLFRAGVHPLLPAGRLSLAQWQRLLAEIRGVLAEAIRVGGTTIRNFSSGDGKPGYFAQTLNVYGRGGQACRACGATLKEARVAGRSTVFCPQCQPRRTRSS